LQDKFREMRKATFEIIKAMLVLLFVYAAVSKLIAFDTFKIQLGLSPLLGGFAAMLAWAIPMIELLIAGLLMIGTAQTEGLYCSLILMSAFTIYLILMLMFSKHIPCSCGGILQGLSWKIHTLFNLFVIGLILIGIKLQHHDINTPQFKERLSK